MIALTITSSAIFFVITFNSTRGIFKAGNNYFAAEPFCSDGIDDVEQYDGSGL